MTKLWICLTISALGLFAAEPPKSWIDPDTGHCIVRLTDEPGSASLYFNQNGYTADGKKMVYTTPQGIHLLCLFGLQIEHVDSLRCGVDHLLAVRGVAVLVEVEAGAAGLVGEPHDAVSCVGVDPGLR